MTFWLLSRDVLTEPTYRLAAVTIGPVASDETGVPVSCTIPALAVSATVPVPDLMSLASVRLPLVTVRVTSLSVAVVPAVFGVTLTPLSSAADPVVQAVYLCTPSAVNEVEVGVVNGELVVKRWLVTWPTVRFWALVKSRWP